jgi:hypothetical protein
VQVIVCVGRRRAVGPFGHDLGADSRRVLHRDLVLERRRNQHVDVKGPQIVIRQRVCVREALDGLPLLDVRAQRREVEAAGVVDAALPVGDRDDPGAEPCQQLGGYRADVAKALDRDGGAVDVESQVLRRLARHDRDAASGRLAAPERPAHFDRLAGDDRGFRMADVHAVGVHDPRHHLIVGVDVGRRHILLRPDEIDDFGDVPAGQRLQLALRHPRRVADDPAFAAAEGDVRDGALPRHPGGERRDLVERDVRVIADAPLRRAERDVVLHTVAGEDLDFPVVHLHRARHDNLPLRVGENAPDPGIEIEDARGSVELLKHRAEQRAVLSHHGIIFHGWWVVVGGGSLRRDIENYQLPTVHENVVQYNEFHEGRPSGTAVQDHFRPAGRAAVRPGQPCIARLRSRPR